MGEIENEKKVGKAAPGEECITVWVDSGLKRALDREAESMGLSRSWVLRYLIKRWVLARKAGAKPLLEEVGV